MIRRLCKGQFNENYKKTIGVDYSEVELDLPEQGKVRLMLWDTAGQDEFDPVTRSYYENANGVVLAFSTTDRDSFERIKSWREKVEAVCDDLCMVLVQNKIDLIDQAVVTNEEAEALARDLKLKFYRVSVKEYFNVLDVFTYLVQLYFKRLKKNSLNAASDLESREMRQELALSRGTQSNNLFKENEEKGNAKRIANKVLESDPGVNLSTLPASTASVLTASTPNSDASPSATARTLGSAGARLGPRGKDDKCIIS
ncbi:Ras- protein Rab-23 [Phlyctochytrium bullatum]|nr:Ras- protein Rab-23 [Phlyctochytrium bullatum]